MFVFLMTLVRLTRAVWRGLRDPEFRALLCVVGVLILSGALFYTRVEGWSFLDSVYFCVTTLTTVGYGDLSPTTPASKIFTIIYIVFGIGILLGFLAKVATNVLEGRRELAGKLLQRRVGGKDGSAASDQRLEP